MRKPETIAKGTTIRVLARILRRRGNSYELQTKHSILRSRYRAQNLNRID
jgi:hypothetical protein